VGRVGSRPLPPAPLPEPWGGGGGAGGSGPAWYLEQGRGGSLPCELGGSHSHVDMANLYGNFIRQVYMANLYGNFIWRVCLAGQMGSFTQRFESKKTLLSNEIERNEMYMVNL